MTGQNKPQHSQITGLRQGRELARGRAQNACESRSGEQRGGPSELDVRRSWRLDLGQVRTEGLESLVGPRAQHVSLKRAEHSQLDLTVNHCITSVQEPQSPATATLSPPLPLPVDGEASLPACWCQMLRASLGDLTLGRTVSGAFQNRKDLMLMPGAQGALMLRPQDNKDTWFVTKQEAQAMPLRVQGGPVGLGTCLGNRA